VKVLATGATGTYAGLVLPALVERGLDVRALVHEPVKADIARAHGAVEAAERYGLTLSQGKTPSPAASVCSRRSKNYAV
jgi:uncharacterized protein YbjT (DUF2867 family)